MGKKQRKKTSRRKPKDRFRVICDSTNNSSEDIEKGNINVIVEAPVGAVTDVRFLCPFCGNVKTVDVGHTDYGESFILHELDPCQKFIDLEVDDYLREVRLHFEKTKPVMN